MKDYRKIQVWQKAHELALSIYQITQQFPSHEIYGLTSQLRRAAVSIPTNIAEGYGRSTDNEIARFMDISLGSVNEVDYLLFLAMNLRYIKQGVAEQLFSRVEEIRKMLTAFTKTVRNAAFKAGSRKLGAGSQ